MTRKKTARKNQVGHKGGHTSPAGKNARSRNRGDPSALRLGRFLRRRHPVLPLVVAVAIVLVVRLVYLAGIQHNPFFDDPILDSRLYDSWAQRIASGDWLGSQVFFMGPLYPYFLAGVYLLFGVSHIAAAAIQLLLGSISCVLVLLLARKLAGTFVGAAATLMLAFYGPLVFFDSLLLPEVLGILANLAWLYVLVRGWPYLRPRAFFASGVIVGVSILVRGSAVILVIGTAAWLVLTHGVKRGQVWRRLAAFAVGICLLVVPVTVRNWVVEHDFVLVTSNGGLNFFVGNNDKADGMYVNLKELRMVSGAPDADWTGRHYAEQTLGRKLRPSEVSGFWFGKSVDFVRDHPGRFFGLLLKKIVLFWNAYEVPQIEDYYIWKSISPPPLPLISFGLVAPLGIVGMLLTARRREFHLLHVFVIFYMVSVCLFFVTARYRVQVVPVLSIFSAYTIWWLINQVRQGRVLRIAGVLVLILLAGIATGKSTLDAMGIRPSEESWYVHLYKGTRFLNEPGGLETAINELSIAARINPKHSETFNNLGLAYDGQGMHREALGAFQHALKLDSAYVEAWYNLAFLTQRRADYVSAIPLYTRVLELQPYFPSAHFNLAICYFRAGRLPDATRHLREVIRLEPQNAEAHNQLGIVLAEQGELGEALEEFRAALRIRPDYSEAMSNMNSVLRSMSDK
jgi:tetratricopeptide (TPR) repeat protein